MLAVINKHRSVSVVGRRVRSGGGSSRRPTGERHIQSGRRRTEMRFTRLTSDQNLARQTAHRSRDTQPGVDSQLVPDLSPFS